jgi:hypothetical protein
MISNLEVIGFDKVDSSITLYCCCQSPN